MKIIEDLELKLCPFCKGKAQIIHYQEWSWAQYSIECSSCGATFNSAFYTAEDAANYWNKRS